MKSQRQPQPTKQHSTGTRYSGVGEGPKSEPIMNRLLHCTWDMKGPVSTPTAEDRNSCDCGSALPLLPTATPFMLAKPGIVAKFSVKTIKGSNHYTPTTIVFGQDGTRNRMVYQKATTENRDMFALSNDSQEHITTTMTLAPVQHRVALPTAKIRISSIETRGKILNVNALSIELGYSSPQYMDSRHVQSRDQSATIV